MFVSIGDKTINTQIRFRQSLCISRRTRHQPDFSLSDWRDATLASLFFADVISTHNSSSIAARVANTSAVVGRVTSPFTSGYVTRVNKPPWKVATSVRASAIHQRRALLSCTVHWLVLFAIMKLWLIRQMVQTRKLSGELWVVLKFLSTAWIAEVAYHSLVKTIKVWNRYSTRLAVLKLSKEV